MSWRAIWSERSIVPWGNPRSFAVLLSVSRARPHPLSARIEEALKAGLALTDQLHVLELPTSGNASIAHDAEVEVSGVYELYRGNLLVKATLTRLTDHGLESASETTIPRAAVPRKDFQSLRSSTHDLSVLPKHSDSATHDEWVEALWHYHNPEHEFRTWIKPQKSVYQDNENAVFFFKTERDCYLWVFTIDVAGTGAVLLPNTYRQDLRQTLVQADEGWVSIPGPADQFTLPISSAVSAANGLRPFVRLVRLLSFPRIPSALSMADRRCLSFHATTNGFVTWAWALRSIPANGVKRTRWSAPSRKARTRHKASVGLRAVGSKRIMKSKRLSTPKHDRLRSIRSRVLLEASARGII